MRSSKQKGTWKPFMRERMRMVVHESIDIITKEVLRTYCRNCHPNACPAKNCWNGNVGITLNQYESWVYHFEDETQFMQKQRGMLKDLEH